MYKKFGCETGDCPEIEFDEEVVRLRNSRWPEDVVQFTYAEWAGIKLAVFEGKIYPDMAG